MTQPQAPFALLHFTAAPLNGDVAIVELRGRFERTGRFARRPLLVLDGTPRIEFEPVRSTVVEDRWEATYAVPTLALDGAAPFALSVRGTLLELPEPDVGEGTDRFLALAREANALRRAVEQAEAAAAEATATLEAERTAHASALTEAVAATQAEGDAQVAAAQAALAAAQQEHAAALAQAADERAAAEGAWALQLETTREQAAGEQAAMHEQSAAALAAQREELTAELIAQQQAAAQGLAAVQEAAAEREATLEAELAAAHEAATAAAVREAQAGLAIPGDPAGPVADGEEVRRLRDQVDGARAEQRELRKQLRAATVELDALRRRPAPAVVSGQEPTQVAPPADATRSVALSELEQDPPTAVVGLHRTTRGPVPMGVSEPPISHPAGRSPGRWVALAALLAFLLVVVILLLGQ